MKKEINKNYSVSSILEQSSVHISQCATLGLVIKLYMDKTEPTIFLWAVFILVTGEINNTFCHSATESIFLGFSHFKFCFLHNIPFHDNPSLEFKLAVTWNGTPRFIFWYSPTLAKSFLQLLVVLQQNPFLWLWWR